MTIDETTFQSLADTTLAAIQDTAEEVLGDSLEADLQGGVLTIELDAGGQYVLNKHGPNRQIWMSSPTSGATHFAWDAASSRWLSTRGGAELKEMLAEELSRATGRAVSFD